MHNLPGPYLSLLNSGACPASLFGRSLRLDTASLFSGGILAESTKGRGARIEVKLPERYRDWLHRRYPGFDGSISAPVDLPRASAVLAKQDSKAGGAGVAFSILSLRSLHANEAIIQTDGGALDVGALTDRHGCASCLITDHTSIDFAGFPVVLVENLETFCIAERFVSGPAICLYSAGKISNRLIGLLERSSLPTLVHFTDYDPSGLFDYLRIKEAMGNRASLYIPRHLALLFDVVGSKKLLCEKPRNQELLERLSASAWPCVGSKGVFELIKSKGKGLEQEALALSIKDRDPEDESTRSFRHEFAGDFCPNLASTSIRWCDTCQRFNPSSDPDISDTSVLCGRRHRLQFRAPITMDPHQEEWGFYRAGGCPDYRPGTGSD